MLKKHHLFSLIFIILLVYSRFVGLGWGLPYPMHPDERNMAVALMQLHCGQIASPECLNPHFFAYGQFPLYLAYFFLMVYKITLKSLRTPINFEEAVIVLRLISASASVITVLILVKSLKSINQSLSFPFLVSLPFIFSPGLIQLSHFGTTESLLMLFYTALIYVSIELLLSRITLKKYIISGGILCGLAIATKVNAAVFLIVPFISLSWYNSQKQSQRKLLQLFFSFMNLLCMALLFSIIFSPFNIIDLQDFIGAIRYEASVATGSYLAFYTRQFVGSIPIFFQFTRIFPYALGWVVLVMFMLGFLLLPFNKLYNILRVSFLGYFITSAFLFAKWTRFMSPVFPIMLLIAILFAVHLYSKIRGFTRAPFFILFSLIILVSSLPGIAYLSVYLTPDVRFVASEWIVRHIPTKAFILSETANVVDLPISVPGVDQRIFQNIDYSYISFNFYELDNDFSLQDMLVKYIDKADYIFVPSRRVFMDETCLNPDTGKSLNDVSQAEQYNRFELVGGKEFLDQCQKREEKYFVLNSYYQRLFSGNLGFKKVVEFTSYPRIVLFGKKIVEFPDEPAEESWSVFDHPVIRIYKKV